MKNILLAITLFSSLLSFGQGAAVNFSPVLSSIGPVPFVQIHFCTTPTVVTSGVCSTPVTVYQNITLVTPYSSAIQTDGLGNFPPVFFSPAANYCYSLSGFPAATNICYPFSVPLVTGSSGPLSFPCTIVIADIVMGNCLSSLVNGLNLLAEFQLAEGNHTTTEGVTGGVSIPNTATALQAEGIGGYSVNSSTTTFSFGGYFQSRCAANSTKCGGINPVVLDTSGLTSGITMYAMDLVVAPRNANTAYSIVDGVSVSLAGPANGQAYGQGVDVSSQSTSMWNFAFRSRDGAAATGLQLGALCTIGTCNSQPITVSSYNSNVLQSGSWQMDQNGNMFWSPSSTAFFGSHGFIGVEGSCSLSIGGQDVLCADSTAHRFKQNPNGGSYAQVVDAGVDINNSDQVTATHLSSPLPTAQGGTGQNSSATFPTSGTVAVISGSQAFQLGCNGTAAAGTTITMAWPGYATTACTNTNTTIQMPAASAGNAKNLRVRCGTGGIAAGSGVFTLIDTGGSTALTCTIGTGTTCSDTSHSVAIAAGDPLLIQFTTQGGETLANCAATFEKQ